VNMPFVGRITVAGKTTGVAERAIETAYIDGGIYKRISVSIIPPENEFYVRGYVNRPGGFPITPNMTVSQALSVAGGWNEYADPTAIKLVRGGTTYIVDAIKVEKQREKDRVIEPGDVIIVPKSIW